MRYGVAGGAEALRAGFDGNPEPAARTAPGASGILREPAREPAGRRDH